MPLAHERVSTRLRVARYAFSMSRTPSPEPTPVVSRVCEDGTLVEALYDASQARTSLAIRTPDGTVSTAPHLDLPTGERLVPYSPSNNLIATECVLLPSAVGDFGDMGDKGDLVAKVREYLYRYVDLSSGFLDIATYYVLLTWVYDAFNELGYLRFRGDFGTGKTRALIAVGSVCYKPFFASGASTVSPIFHVLNAFGGTLVLDEADLRFSDATADLTKILNNGNVRGLPVLRTMQNRHRELNPHAFRVFGPKLIAMREGFQDDALESRFLTEETGRRPLRPDIPIHLPESLKSDALALRNRLLAWRFAARHTVAPDPSRLLDGVSPRLNQTALALLSIVDDASVRDAIRRELVGGEARVLHERASSTEATMLRALLATFDASDAPYASIASVTERFNKDAASRFGRTVGNKWVGGFVRTRLKLATMKTRGTYVVPQSERPRVETLALRYGFDSNRDVIAH